MLPRKDTGVARSRGVLESAAYQIGVLVAVERNRWKMTQGEVAQTVGGIKQEDVSALENGRAVKMPDAKVSAVFTAVGLDGAGAQANYVMWWRLNSTL